MSVVSNSCPRIAYIYRESCLLSLNLGATEWRKEYIGKGAIGALPSSPR